MVGNDKAAVRSAVEVLLRQGIMAQGFDPGLGVGEPLAVSNPDGSQYSWLVPLLSGTKLEGFAQLLPSLVPLGFSSFRLHSSEKGSWADAADWINMNRVLARAATLAKKRAPIDAGAYVRWSPESDCLESTGNARYGRTSKNPFRGWFCCI